MNLFKKKIQTIFFLLLLSTVIPFQLLAGDGTKDSLKISEKNETKDSLTSSSKKRANRVAIMSAVIPGLGQIANKKYWKLPIIYGATGVLIYFIKTNNSEYDKFKKALIYRNDNDSMTVDDYPRFTNDDLTVRKDYYRRNRDLSYIFAGVLYTLNVIDAYVDSQLMNFDISDNLSIRTTGTIDYLPDNIPVASLKLIINF
jgi:Family of unknown function (DUF5683)